MSSLSLPNTFTNNVSYVDAVPLQANMTAIQTSVNSIDHTNMGAAGIYATSLIPTTTGQGTFGGITAGVGYTFLASDKTSVPLTISGVTSQTADILDVTLTSGGTNAFKIDHTGAATFGFSITTSNNIIGSDVKGTGNVHSDGGVVYATSSGGLSNPGVSTGDVAAQRSSSTGAYFAGGAVNAGVLEWNIANGSSFSLRNSGLSGYVPISGGAYTNASDASLKMNIAAITSGTTEIMALKPSSFTWIASQQPGLGFIAQDVKNVLPVLVSTDNDGVMGVNYDGIIPVLVKAFQEMQAGLHAAGVAGF